jgi:hypothetical protein
MSLMGNLTRKVVDVFRVSPYAEFATISAKGIPIDTPLLSFLQEDLSRITMATGLAYPVKAERARRNAKVGLLYNSNRPDEPIVQVIGMATVRDRDLQQNLLTYLAEAGPIAPEVPWDVKRCAIWYWARILIDIYPTQILWWDSPAALNGAPARWDAPADAQYPPSDPAPAGQNTPAPLWPQPKWQQLAQADINAEFPAYVSIGDAAGFPRIAPASDVQMVDGGLSFELPRAAPGLRTGPATLTYFGRDTFVGHVREDGSRMKLEVERALPILPLVADPRNTWNPPLDVKEPLMRRLAGEVGRRGQTMPVVPQDQPEATEGAKRRAVRSTKGADAAIFEQSA